MAEWQCGIVSSAPISAARFATGYTTLDIASVPLLRDAMTADLDLVWHRLLTSGSSCPLALASDPKA